MTDKEELILKQWGVGTMTDKEELILKHKQSQRIKFMTENARKCPIMTKDQQIEKMLNTFHSYYPNSYISIKVNYCLNVCMNETETNKQYELSLLINEDPSCNANHVNHTFTNLNALSQFMDFQNGKAHAYREEVVNA